MKWISVKERLPERGTNVIVFDFVDVFGGAFYSRDGSFYLSDSCRLYNVTHWMPLPEPPEES